MDDLAGKGFFVLGGPLADEVRVVLAVEAESAEAVRETLAADPWHETHLLIDSIEPWTIRVDGRRDEPSVFRVGGISYLRILSDDPRRSADFYHAVFGWNMRGESDSPSFDDGTGHVIGHFVPGQTVADGVRPYIYVERVDDTLEKVAAQGGEIVTPPYPEGDLWVATFRDPAGNQVGVWQRGPR
jgi:predicted enzyme related to lactoylglutathione lyase